MSDEDSDGPDYRLVWSRIAQWTTYRSQIGEPKRYMTLKNDLWVVRNPEKDQYAYSILPAELIDSRDEINASVEHYFLCRAWVGNGVYSAAQLSAMNFIYNTGKSIGITPRSNPNHPVTPASDMQKYFQRRGIDDGISDGIIYGTKAGSFSLRLPPTYW